MTSTATFPSADFPGHPGLALDHPDDWYPLTDVALPLAVAKHVPEGDFRPNVVVAVTRVRGDVTLDQAIETTMGRLTGLDGYAEVGREHVEVDGWPGFRAELSFADPRVGTMAQAIRIAVVARGSVADLVEMTGSCTAAQVESTWPEIRAVQSSLKITA
jgi:hypothetical protein